MNRYGAAAVAFLGALFVVVRGLAGDGFTDQEVIMTGLAVATAVGVYFVPLFEGSAVGRYAKTAVAVAVAGLGFLVDASLGGLTGDEKWQLVELCLVALGVPLTQLLGFAPKPFIARALPSSGPQKRDNVIDHL